MRKQTNVSRKEMMDVAYARLLDSVDVVNPKLRDILQGRYEQERSEFHEAAREATPSQEPSYWAKAGCNKCYGRGTLGKKSIFKKDDPAVSYNGKYTNAVVQFDVRCKCVHKNYQKWLVDFRKEYNDLKAQSTEVTEVTEETANG